MTLLNQLQQSNTQYNTQKDNSTSSASLIPSSIAPNHTEGYLGNCSILNNSSSELLEMLHPKGNLID